MRSSPQLRSSVEGRKKHLIHLLINNGIYKKSERHLYEIIARRIRKRIQICKEGAGSWRNVK
ncbi:histidine kinase [Bacillus amyloliquefaciens]|nr:histidine kinase [Bacillus amyloliquefaciens]